LKFNVVLITVDSLRADFLGVYNEEIRKEKISSNIDKWANESTVFANALSQSCHTSPSFLAMLSGNYPSKYGDWFSKLSEKRPFISEIFRQNGYSTYAFNSNPHISSYTGFQRGFDVFRDNMPVGKKLNKQIILQIGRLKALIKEPYERAETINDQVIKLLRNISTPYFLWIHFMDVHGPYVSKKGWSFGNRIKAASLWRKALQSSSDVSESEKKRLIETYKEEITYLDKHMATLFDHLQDENTIITFTADHGDLFGEHGAFGHPLRLYNRLLHIPLVIKFPKSIQVNNRTIHEPVGLMDLVPTLIDVLNMKTDHIFDGESLRPLINETAIGNWDKFIISEVSRKHLCISRGRWKLFVDYSDNLMELYDIYDDPEEKKNVLFRHKEIAEELESVLQAHCIKYSSVDKDRPQKLEHNEEIKARLKSLGYMD
jgi:arylsulfatase A-like enzyme